MWLYKFFYQDDLMQGDKVVGTRIHVVLRIGYSNFDVLCIDTSDDYVIKTVTEDLEFCGFNNQGKSSKLYLSVADNDLFVTNNEPKRVVYYEEADVHTEGACAWRDHLNFIGSVVTSLEYVHARYCDCTSRLVHYLISYGGSWHPVKAPRSDKIAFCVTTFNLGGVDNWVLDEDRGCYALKEDMREKLKLAIKDFNDGEDLLKVTACDGDNRRINFFFNDEDISNWYQNGSISDWTQKYDAKYKKLMEGKKYVR